jgi:hypothetical protein
LQFPPFQQRRDTNEAEFHRGTGSPCPSRVGARAAKRGGPLRPRRPVESGVVSWPSGARRWCRSGSGPARRRRRWG